MLDVHVAAAGAHLAAPQLQRCTVEARGGGKLGARQMHERVVEQARVEALYEL